MTRPLSNDLRERVVAAVVGRRELPRGGGAIRCCGVVGGEVVAALRATGSVAPGRWADIASAFWSRIGPFIVERMRQTPHLTLHGLKDELAARGVKVSHNAVWMFLRREGLRFKKNTIRA